MTRHLLHDNSASSNNLIKGHATMMLLAFLVFLAFGGIVAR